MQMNAPPGRNLPAGVRARPVSEFEERVVQIDRVARVVKGGRRFRFRATVVVGDRKNRVGLGIAKAGEVQGAIQKAVSVAKKDMITVKMINNSIPFAVSTSFAGADLLMKPARQGTGIIAGGAVRPIIELSGITNILSKSLGSNNRINNAKAAMRGLRLISDTDITKLTDMVAARAVKQAAAINEPTVEQPESGDNKKPLVKAPAKAPAKASAKPTAKKAPPAPTFKPTGEKSGAQKSVDKKSAKNTSPTESS